VSERRYLPELPLGGADGPPWSKGLMARALAATGLTLTRAYELARGDRDFEATDDASVVLRYLPDVTVHVVEGSPRNLKVTVPDHLLLVEALKESDERLRAWRLSGRYDLDMSGGAAAVHAGDGARPERALPLLLAVPPRRVQAPSRPRVGLPSASRGAASRHTAIAARFSPRRRR